jgi:hypothetical protein
VIVASKKNHPIIPPEDRPHHTDIPGRSTLVLLLRVYFRGSSTDSCVA